MSETNNKSPFRVPENYFDLFEKDIMDQVNSAVSENGFTTPKNYFNEVDNQILEKLNSPIKDGLFSTRYWYRVVAVAAVALVFYFNDKINREQSEMAELFIEDYLIENSTYDIADHSDYYNFGVDNFLSSYESIEIDNALELRLYGENPTNLNLFDDE